MKSIIISILFCLFSIIALSQNNNNRFSFKFDKKYNNYIVRPLFDQPAFKGKKGMLHGDNELMNKIFSKTITEVFPKEKLSSLHKGNYYILNLNSDGDIFYCWFIISAADKKLITEDDLYRLYNKFKEIKIDKSTIRIIPGYGFDNRASPSYSEIMGSFIHLK